jgi:hypothetical protein
MNATIIPSEFTEFKHNEIKSNTHTIVYEYVKTYYLDGYEYAWKHQITIKTNDDEITIPYMQYRNDSCKYTFLDNYHKLCKRLGVAPLKMA